MEKSTQSTNFKAEINEKRQSFEKLLNGFNTHDDPVLRYIKRQRMKEIQEYLSEFDINVEVP